jgi:hypothetical protein
MTDSALQWLTERASQPGTLAGALRRPDGTFISHSLDPSCLSATIEKILTDFDVLAPAIAEPAAPQWSTWDFELGKIRFVERPDGWRLALVVRKESAAAPALDSVSQEFLTNSFDAL